MYVRARTSRTTAVAPSWPRGSDTIPSAGKTVSERRERARDSRWETAQKAAAVEAVG